VITLIIKRAAGLGYFAGFEACGLRATPGRLLLGLQVTDMAGARISFGRGVARFVGKVLSGAIVGLGYTLAGFTKDDQALHDLIASTLGSSGQTSCAPAAMEKG